MALTPGARIGSFEVVAAVGAGGMGEVYQARDARLGRDVALKVLPDLFVADAERLSRFEREARTLAALNHPHIAHIYGVEESGTTRALVMELVPGRTLEEIIRQSGRLPLNEALTVARQIADALEAAHDQTIVHRDLKPANIKVRDDGVVKVLDFGLARAVRGEPGGPHEMSPSPSALTSPAMTAMGIVMGTAAYMSPEQARGGRVDRRADLWAFGVVLFEMLTGRPTFPGESITDVLASVVKDEPDWSALPPETPAPVRRLLRRCLEKDPNRRLRDAADARLEIEDTLAARADDPRQIGTSIRPAAARPGRGRSVWWWAASLLVALGVGAAAGWWFKRVPELPVRRFSIQTPDGLRPTDAVISPDGRAVAFMSVDKVWVQRLDRGAAQEILEAAGARRLFWSPDGTHLGYQARGQLWKVALDGGSPVAIGPVSGEFSAAGAAAWLSSDRILYTTGGSGLLEIPAQGGTSRTLLEIDAAREVDFHDVSPLPDGRSALFVPHLLDPNRWIIELFDGRERHRLFESDAALRHPFYSPSGHILFVRGQGVWALKFDLAAMRVSGEPFLVAPDTVRPSASTDGTLLVVPEGSSTDQQLTWVDRQGKVVGTTGRGGIPVSNPRVSPDGTQVLATVAGSNPDLYVFDLERGTDRRLTFEPGANDNGVWSPDGKFVVYQCQQAICARPADGSGTRVVLLPGPAFDPVVSPDGKYLLFVREQPRTSLDIAIVPLGETGLTAPPAAEPRPFVSAERLQMRIDISPDGRLAAYDSNEAGDYEVYLTTFPGGEGKWQASRGNSQSPRWSATGDRIFYDSAGSVMEVAVDRLPAPAPRAPTLLFSGLAVGARLGPYGFDRSLDGSRFLVVRPSSGAAETGSILLVQQWFREHGGR